MKKSEIVRLNKLNKLSHIGRVISSCETHEQLRNAIKWWLIILHDNWSYDNCGSISEFCIVRTTIQHTIDDTELKINRKIST